MHAVTIVDGALAWRPHPDPEPGTGELLVRVRAAGVCRGDLMQRDGLYPPPPGPPRRTSPASSWPARWRRAVQVSVASPSATG